MPTHAQKSNAIQWTMRAESPKLSGQRRDVDPGLQLQSAIGNQAVQRLLQASAGHSRLNSNSAEDIQQLAHHGTAGNAVSLPYLGQIQQSFGPGYDLRHVRAYVGGQAAEAARSLRAQAYTTGEEVAFSSSPNLHTAAHEAAHVVQQRSGIQLKGGVGESGDPYERHADAVADAVVRGGSAESLLNRIPQESAGHAGPHPVQRRTDWDAEGRTMMREVEDAARELVKQYHDDPVGLAARIISDLSTQTNSLDDFYLHQPAYRALKYFPDQAGLAAAIAKQLTNDRVQKLAASRPGMVQSLAMTVLRGGLGAEAERIMSFVVGPAHAHLFGETAAQNPAVQAVLKDKIELRYGNFRMMFPRAKLQSIASGTGLTVFDEYSIIMDEMPPKLTAEAYLTEMTQDLNAAVKSETFDKINEFTRTQKDQQRGNPAVGDIYDIDILGPDNGSVILVERTSNLFIFQTVETLQTGMHPEFGSREFGFEVLEKGAVRWYTRGASRAGSDVAAAVGAPVQKLGWTAMVTGIANTLKSRGGRIRPGSFDYRIRRL